MNIKVTISKLIRKSYVLTRLLYIYKFRKNGVDPQSIIIYQMGKVGSTSILHSLQSANSFPAVFQIHTLSDVGIKEMERRYWGNTPMFFRRSLLPETTHVYISHALKSQLGNGNNVKRKIITLVRDPIARNVSEFFYSVDTTKDNPHLPNFYSRYYAGDIKVPDLVNRFLERFAENTDEYSVPLNWFTREFLSVLGVDIYSVGFPKSKGFDIIKTNKYDILVLKLERLKDCYSDAIREFLGIQNHNLITTNAASQKDYFEAYRSFLQEVKLPSQYISKIYKSTLVQHFYSAQEIEHFTKKWQKS